MVYIILVLGVSICCSFYCLTVFLFILNRVSHFLGMSNWGRGRDIVVMGLYADEFSVLVRMHTITENVLRFP